MYYCIMCFTVIGTINRIEVRDILNQLKKKKKTHDKIIKL